MTAEEAIKNFVGNRPKCLSAYGYGSGVFKQVSYDETSTPLTDVILIVEDLKKWHLENIQKNPKDYSLIGRLTINRGSIKRLKGNNNITYFSEVKDKGSNFTFKYGVIEIEDFISSLKDWNNFFVAGRFHKPVLQIKENFDVEQEVEKNKKRAFMVACLLSNYHTTKRNVLINLCGLSYLGDARMKIAENPHKIENIVDGNYDHLLELYPFNEDFIIERPDGTIVINYRLLLSRINELPKSLFDFLAFNDTDLSDINSVRKNIQLFLYQKNSQESKSQIIEGIRTNGIVRSIPYATAKIKKRFSK